MQVSQLIEDTYYVNANGAMAVSEWKKLDDVWHYFGSDGSMVKTGWKFIDNEWYCFKNGKMVKITD